MRDLDPAERVESYRLGNSGRIRPEEQLARWGAAAAELYELLRFPLDEIHVQTPTPRVQRGVARLKNELAAGPSPTRSANEDEVLEIFRTGGEPAVGRQTPITRLNDLLGPYS